MSDHEYGPITAFKARADQTAGRRPATLSGTVPGYRLLDELGHRAAVRHVLAVTALIRAAAVAGDEAPTPLIEAPRDDVDSSHHASLRHSFRLGGLGRDAKAATANDGSSDDASDDRCAGQRSDSHPPGVAEAACEPVYEPVAEPPGEGAGQAGAALDLATAAGLAVTAALDLLVHDLGPERTARLLRQMAAVVED